MPTVMSTHTYTRIDSNKGCTKETCDLIWSIYGSRSSLPFTLFPSIFAFSAHDFLIQGLHPRTHSNTWLLTVAMNIGSSSEVLSYVAKSSSTTTPSPTSASKMNVVLLTSAPAF